MQLFLLTPAPSIPGDFDFDGHVDGDDLAVWRSAFGVDAAGDADGDRDSDASDFLGWQRNLGAGGPAEAASNFVPEPTTCALAVLCFGMARFGRRRDLTP
jgi:hypothetical protein